MSDCSLPGRQCSKWSSDFLRYFRFFVSLSSVCFSLVYRVRFHIGFLNRWQQTSLISCTSTSVSQERRALDVIHAEEAGVFLQETFSTLHLQKTPACVKEDKPPLIGRRRPADWPPLIISAPLCCFQRLNCGFNPADGGSKWYFLETEASRSGRNEPLSFYWATNSFKKKQT